MGRDVAGNRLGRAQRIHRIHKVPKDVDQHSIATTANTKSRLRLEHKTNVRTSDHRAYPVEPSGQWYMAALVDERLLPPLGDRRMLNRRHSTTGKASSQLDTPCLNPLSRVALFTRTRHVLPSRHRCCCPRHLGRHRRRLVSHRALRQPVSIILCFLPSYG